MTDENLLICDCELPVALAGVMGGENSEVDETTTNLLLESAYFSPAMIRKTAKKLGISTEASKRFERGTDPNGCAHASDAATSLICQYAQGEVASTLLDAYPQVVQQRKVPFRPQRANLVVGEEIPAETAHAILTNLGCTISQKSDQWDVLVPTFRPDLSREIDLIEEVARVFGYDNVAPTDSEKISLTAKRDLTVFHQNRLKNLATLATLSEVITFSFISEKHAQLFVESPASLVKLLNPLSEEMAVLRPMLFASMLPVISYNINRKHSDLRIFELGSVFQHRADSKHILESVHFAGLLTGMQNEHTWNSKPKASSFFDLKGILQAILDQANVADDLVFTEAKFPLFSYAATVRTTKDQIGVIGKFIPMCLHSSISKKMFLPSNWILTRLPDSCARIARNTARFHNSLLSSETWRSLSRKKLRLLRLWIVSKGQEGSCLLNYGFSIFTLESRSRTR